MRLPPPPNERELLPPLLACLPTSFVSPQPPPALLPLLSPLLRQRVNFLASNTPSRNDGWLPLLSWDVHRAAKLAPVVERMHLEPHPVSGELEIDELRPAKYRRLDEETLHSRLEVEQFEILPIFVWCDNDEHGETGAGWKLAELRSMEDLDDRTEWYESISDANDAAPEPSGPMPELRENGDRYAQSRQAEDDDDDYWAAYDRTPGRTPALKDSPAPRGLTATTGAPRQRSQSELDYYARYGAEVQPAMDSHDPDEEHADLGESTLNGNTLLSAQPPSHHESGQPGSRPNGTSLFPADAPPARNVEAPRPISPISSGGSSSVDRLEERAVEMSEAQAPDRAQLAIQQHISTDIKSLFRLAKNSGMERRDFERLVKRELEVLVLLEQDD